MVYLGFFLLGLLCLAVATSVLPLLPAACGRPEPLSALVTFCGLRLDPLPGALLVLLLGLVTDIYSGVFSGLYPIVYLGLFCLFKLCSPHLLVESPFLVLPVAAASALAVNGGLYLFHLVLAADSLFAWSWLATGLQAAVVGLLAIPLFRILDRLLVIGRPKGRNTLRP
ncbi:MAG: hypothetical protein AB1634_02300 [Thermodesulfobacteriota bacterium]